MYAIVSTGGKQYRVSRGDTLRVEKIDAAVGDTVVLGQVHMVAKEDGVLVTPEALSAAKVTVKVTGHGRGKKIRVFKYKRRKNYRRTQGHRQDYTEIRVQEIEM